MPIIRCYHHIHEGKIRAHPRNDDDGSVNWNTAESFFITLNVAYAGNVFVGPLWWEGSIQPGDKNQ